MRIKIAIFLILSVVAMTMTSCWGNMEPQTSPQFQLLSPLYLNPQFNLTGDSILGAQDTLGTTYNTEIGMEYLDTIQVGDTVAFSALFSAEYNRLVSIATTTDTAKVDFWFDVNNMSDEDFNKAFKEGSDPTKGILYFNPLYNKVILPVYIVPTGAGVHPVKITITSDSQFPTIDVKFMMPVL